MSEKAQRRRFTAAYKLKVLQEADRSTKSGELGALLRREGLYSSHLAAWRAARRRGPTPTVPDPHIACLAMLERQLAVAVQRADRAEAIVEVQKKVAALLGAPLPPTAPS